MQKHKIGISLYLVSTSRLHFIMKNSCKISLVVSSKSEHNGREAKVASICQFLVQRFLGLFSNNRIFGINVDIRRQFADYQVIPICRRNKALYMLLCFHSNDYSECNLLGCCDTVQHCRCIQTFSTCCPFFKIGFMFLILTYFNASSIFR